MHAESRGMEQARAAEASPDKIPIIHDAEKGGFRAEVPALPGCASQRESDLHSGIVTGIRTTLLS